jgi:hypothetical protein
MRTSTASAATSLVGPLLKNTMPVIAVLLMAFFVGSVLFGAWLNFSPVPTEDSWRGMVDFYLESRENPLAWWAQHNDHRIFFAKLLFWLDMHFLDGSGKLLIPANIILLLSTWGVMCAFANRLIDFPSRREQILVWAVLGMLCLAWMQNTNIISSFQSEFILAFLLPLLSFYCFARALQSQPAALRWLVASVLFAVASAYCLINGLFALPMLALLSGFAERSPRRVIILLLCAAASLAVFLIDYQPTMANPLGLAKLRTDPSFVLTYALAYLGGPWHAVFGRIDVAIGFGAVAVVLTAYLFFSRAGYRNKPFALALIAYIVYVFGAAGMTAVGRSLFALELATTSRYLTPTLFMWAAMLILLLARSPGSARWSTLALVMVAALLVPTQMGAFRLEPSNFKISPHTKAVAALSLQIDIDDLNAKSALLLFYSEHAEELFQRARNHRVSIFSERYAFPANQIGKRLQEVSGEYCSGQITISKLVDERRAAYGISGSLAPGSAKGFRYVLFGDADGLVKGVAIARGAPEPLGFDGYVFAQPDFTEMRCVR